MEEAVKEEVCSILRRELQKTLSSMSARLTADRGSWRHSGVMNLCLG